MSLVARLPFLLAAPLLTLACADGGDSNSNSASQGSSPTVATSVTTVTTASASDAGSSGGGEPTGSGSAEAGETSAAASTGQLSGDASSSGGDASSSGGVVTSVGTTTGVTTVDPDTGDQTTGECAAIAEKAMNKKQPADILFVIDNSGSMQIEAGSVKANMNAFSTKIINSGIDVHVVLISSIGGDTGMCIDPPLGGGGCPANDNNLPTFLHINDGVGSNNALEKLLDHHADWKDQMRQGASKHIVVVSDDNSDLGANAFDAAFKALDPSYADYKLHAIVGQKDYKDIVWCASNAVCCALTAAAGKVYIDLINKTGGVYGDLCKQDFTPVFNTLSTEVIQNAGLACEWDIPKPMDEDALDFEKVNVDFNDGMGNVLPIGKVNAEADCANVMDGWYYDDANMPTKILVCPQTCAKIQIAPMASMNIKFGCETIIAQ
jgi:hypothetical protein